MALVGQNSKSCPAVWISLGCEEEAVSRYPENTCINLARFYPIRVRPAHARHARHLVPEFLHAHYTLSEIHILGTG